MKRKILTVGWSSELISSFLDGVEQFSEANFEFVHLVEVGYQPNGKYDELPKNYIPLAINKSLVLTSEDIVFLENLEAIGVPTIRAMIAGDPYLRHLTTEDSLAYAASVARSILKCVTKNEIDIVLASNDRLISSIALAVCNFKEIKYTALAFTVIPDNRTWFIDRLTPNSLIPFKRKNSHPISENQANKIIENFINDRHQLSYWAAPVSISGAIFYNFQRFFIKIRRVWTKSDFKPTKYATLSFSTAFKISFKRLLNRISLFTLKMITEPPKNNFAYFPMHMNPESMVDTWAVYYQDQLSLIKQILLALPLNVELVVKLHFADPDSYSASQLYELTKHPRVHIAHPNSNSKAFLKEAALVFGITGTSSLEAALLGKPVLIFGDSPYVDFPSSQKALKPDELHSQINQVLKQKKPTRKSILKAFEKYCNQYLPGRVNDWSLPLTQSDLKKFFLCFKSLVDETFNDKHRVNK
tara:strand:- start:19698 stop:21110 length:1413 start_codon:yes stop_codon:yes gene_type:complete